MKEEISEEGKTKEKPKSEEIRTMKEEVSKEEQTERKLKSEERREEKEYRLRRKK